MKNFHPYLYPAAGFVCVNLLSFFQNRLLGADAVALMGYVVPSFVGVVTGCVVSACFTWHQKALQEEKEKNDQHSEINTRHEAFLQTFPQGVCTVDGEGVCLQINEAFLQLFDCKSDNVLGKNLFEVIDKEPSHLKKIIQGTPLKHCGEYKLYKLDGCPVKVSVSLYPSPFGTVLTFSEVTLTVFLKSKIDFLHNHEPFCGFLNLAAWKRRVEEAYAKSCTDYDCRNFLFIVDIDRFKIINETVSYAAGDHYLKDFAQFLAFKIGASENICRLGGDEFSFFLLDCSHDEAQSFGQALLQDLNAFETSCQGRVLKCSVSIGGCPISAQLRSFDHVLLGAEAACNFAKESGRSLVRFYDPEQDEYRENHGQMEMVSHIQAALAQDLFFLRGQKIAPIVEGKGRGGMEILVSMRDQSGATISPGSFIPAAETFDLMADIDRWVVQQAITWLEEHAEVCASLDFISINLSGKAFNQDDFADFLHSVVAHSVVPAQKLCFEITETAAVKSRDKVIDFMHKIKTLGCCFALDDFGTGMSSFEYLKNFPVDYIKIDGSFIHGIEHDEISQEIVRSIQRISEKLCVRTIAEHAETEESLVFLQNIGIDFVQGYIIDKPSPLASC